MIIYSLPVDYQWHSILLNNVTLSGLVNVKKKKKKEAQTSQIDFLTSDWCFKQKSSLAAKLRVLAYATVKSWCTNFGAARGTWIITDQISCMEQF